jgi:hypothetical protein
MPTYLFRNNETNEEFESFMTISQKEKYLKENSNIQQIHGSLQIVSGVKDMHSGTDSTWKEVLSKIAQSHPNSELANNYGRKSIKQLKTESILDKHIKRQQNRDR